MPTLVGLGFAGVFGPTRGRVAGVGYSLPLVCGGTPPTTPRHGACAPWTPIYPPPWAEGSPAFWVPLVAGLLMRATHPLFWFCEGTPPTPPPWGLAPPGPPFSHPRGLRVRQPFGSHSWAGLLMRATRPLFWFYGGTPPTTPRHGGFAPLDPRFAHLRWLMVCQRFGPHSWAGC